MKYMPRHVAFGKLKAMCRRSDGAERDRAKSRKLRSSDLKARVYSFPAFRTSVRRRRRPRPPSPAPSTGAPYGSTGCRAINPASIAATSARGILPPNAARRFRASAPNKHRRPSRRMIWPVGPLRRRQNSAACRPPSPASTSSQLRTGAIVSCTKRVRDLVEHRSEHRLLGCEVMIDRPLHARLLGNIVDGGGGKNRARRTADGPPSDRIRLVAAAALPVSPSRLSSRFAPTTS